MELFVIQRCWFSGPHVEPSVDCRRLFTSRREAEEVAYHSAHDYANRSIFGGTVAGMTPSRHHLNATVKTILLPPSSNATSSYAFQTCGKLFWVRSVKATVVTSPPPMMTTMMMTGMTGMTTMTGMNHPMTPDITTNATIDKAEVVFTENIIGGTGNPNSRRGSEATEGHVFVSATNSMAHAKRCAVEVLTRLHMTMRSDVHLTVECIPIGKAPHGNSTIYSDWPPSPRLIQQQQQQHQMQMHSLQYDTNNNMTTMMMGHQVINRNNLKRELVSGDHPDLNPAIPSKRQCQFHCQEAQEQTVSCSMML